MKNYFKKFKDFFRGPVLTGEIANNISKYGYNSFEEVVKSKARLIEEQIADKIRFSRKEKLLALLVPEDQKELYEKISLIFREKGFKTFYASSEQIKELGNNKYLFISWDIN